MHDLEKAFRQFVLAVWLNVVSHGFSLVQLTGLLELVGCNDVFRLFNFTDYGTIAHSP
ncbi:hypothetical protein D3C77_813540 [compost metagenome]